MATKDARGAYIIDTSAAAITTTLPDGAKYAGKTIGPFKRMGASAANFAPAGSDKIDGNSATYGLTSNGSVVSFTWVGGAIGWMSRIEGGAVSVSSSGASGPTSANLGTPTYRWVDHQCEVSIPRIPPSPLGTFKGDHIWGEIPDQSTGTPLVAGTSTAAGSKPTGEWKPLDLAKCGYNPAYPTSKDVFRIPVAILAFKDDATPVVCRFYVQPYSDQVENPVVRNGQSGATPSCTLSIYPEAVTPSGAEHGGAGGTWDVTNDKDDNSTGVLRTQFTATASFDNPDPRVKGWSIWFRGDGETWKQETAMMDLSVTTVVMYFDTPAVLRNIYFARVLHGLDLDGQIKANTVDEAKTPIKKLTFGTNTGTVDGKVLVNDSVKDDAINACSINKLLAGTSTFEGPATFQSKGSNSKVVIRDTDITLQGAGLGYFKADATEVLIASGGTPKISAKSTDITIYGAGTATAKLDATSLVLDSGSGPKATLTTSSLTLDSGGTPKVIVSTAGVQVIQGKVSINASGVTATLDVSSYSDGNQTGYAGLTVTSASQSSAVAPGYISVSQSNGCSFIMPGAIEATSAVSGGDGWRMGIDAPNGRLYAIQRSHGVTQSHYGATGYFGPLANGLYLEIVGGIATAITLTPPI